LVEPASDDLTVDRNDGADRHLAGVARDARLIERRIHQILVHARPSIISPRLLAPRGAQLGAARAPRTRAA